MTQLERITYMEEILDESVETVEQLLFALERYETLKPRLAELEAYYTSSMWRRDFDDDNAGKIPKNLKRGVLSEDAVYDLLRMQQEVKERLK